MSNESHRSADAEVATSERLSSVTHVHPEHLRNPSDALLHPPTALHASKTPYDEQTLATLHLDADLIIARYPQKRSALLPLLHLIQSLDGYVTGRGVSFCAAKLELSDAEVSGVATFYTQYKRHPNGEYTVGVCTNTLCAIMGGDQIFDTLSEHLGIGHDETTADGKVTLERVECNAACDYAPVVMANWEFLDNQTPQSAVALVEDLRTGKDVVPTRGAAKVCTFKQMSRVLAGFSDGLAGEGVGAGGPSLEGLRLAKERGFDPHAPSVDITGDSDADSPSDHMAAGLAGSTDTPANPAGSKAGEKVDE